MRQHQASIVSEISGPEGSGAAGLPPLRVLLAAPRGFCAGVRRAIRAVADALDAYGAPVYVRRAIVHNLAVVRPLQAQGAVFVEELSEVPHGSVVVLSAHGAPPAVAAEAEQRKLVVHDAVCPLVAKVHREVARYHAAGRHILLIGHEGHPEIAGTMGQVPGGALTLLTSVEQVASLAISEDAPLAYAVQTTYSVDDARTVVEALRSRFRNLVGPSSSDICYATTNRQAAVRTIAPMVDAILVVGEHFSSNANRLAEIAAAAGCPAVQLVPDASAIDWRLLPASGSAGITAAASTPEISVKAVIEALGARYTLEVNEIGSPDEVREFRPVQIP